jgi:hypothetical protein
METRDAGSMVGYYHSGFGWFDCNRNGTDNSDNSDNNGNGGERAGRLRRVCFGEDQE